MNEGFDGKEHICKNNKGKDVLLISDSNTGEIMCSSCGQVITENIS